MGPVFFCPLFPTGPEAARNSPESQGVEKKDWKENEIYTCPKDPYMKYPLLPATDKNHPKSIKKNLLIISLLIVSTFMAFWQVTHSDFNYFDDPQYVTENRHIQGGLTIEGIQWAFTTGHASNWHPLTWISHMVDVQLFGLQPGWHHLTNLMFHLANTVLLFLILHRLTKAFWQSAFVAALFTLHPLHVESVAWVAERKDVLSTFLWMLTMGTYVSYVARPGLMRYLGLICCFALGLMAKPMLVTLPFVLLLLDYWPLQRLEQMKPPQKIVKPLSNNKKKGKNTAFQVPVQTAVSQWSLIRPLLIEKIPLFALTLLFSIITYLVQQKGGAMRTLETLPLGSRMANAFVSYIIYMVKMFWPMNLAVFYPHPMRWPLWKVLGSVIALVALTVLGVRGARKRPYVALGWFWYMGTLVPVIGIVQVGKHAMADRYTYIPLIGLFIIVAWGVPEVFKNWRFREEALIALSALCLLCLFFLTWRQVGYWRNSISLYDHTLEVTDGNSLIYNARGVAYGTLGNYRQAIEDYNRAIELNPKFSIAYNNRGVAYGNLGNHRQVIEDCTKAIALDPKYAIAYSNRGNAYKNLGHYRQAIEDYNKAIELNPNYATAYHNRGNAYGNLGNHRQAIEDIKTAARLGDESAQKFLKSQAIGW